MTVRGTVYATGGEFGGVVTGSLNINSGGSSRTEFVGGTQKVFNAGVKRIQIGDLTA